jgi:hypothetical protein
MEVYFQGSKKKSLSDVFVNLSSGMLLSSVTDVRQVMRAIETRSFAKLIRTKIFAVQRISCH